MSAISSPSNCEEVLRTIHTHLGAQLFIVLGRSWHISGIVSLHVVAHREAWRLDLRKSVVGVVVNTSFHTQVPLFLLALIADGGVL